MTIKLTHFLYRDHAELEAQGEPSAAAVVIMKAVGKPSQPRDRPNWNPQLATIKKMGPTSGEEPAVRCDPK